MLCLKPNVQITHHILVQNVFGNNIDSHCIYHKAFFITLFKHIITMSAHVFHVVSSDLSTLIHQRNVLSRQETAPDVLSEKGNDLIIHPIAQNTTVQRIRKKNILPTVRGLIALGLRYISF